MAQADPYRVLKRVFPQVIAHTVWAALVATVYHLTQMRVSMPGVIHPLLGGVLGLLLAFRTNQSYERHWASCKSWAALHKTILNFARLASIVASTDFQRYAAILRLLIAMPVVLKQHLQRRRDPTEYLDILWMREIEVLMASQHPHVVALAELSMLIRPVRAMDDGLGKHLAVWGRMEDCIKDLQSVICDMDLVLEVSLPRSYHLHTARFVGVWVATLPLTLVGTMSPKLLPGVMFFVSWALYSTEEMAELLEAPFSSPATVPLEAFCDRIIAELKQQVFVQSGTDRRVAEGLSVVKPENLVHNCPPKVASTDITDVDVEDSKASDEVAA